MNVRTLVAVVVSLGVGFGLWFYLQNVPRSGVDDRPRSPLVVATRDLGAGAILQALGPHHRADSHRGTAPGRRG